MRLAFRMGERTTARPSVARGREGHARSVGSIEPELVQPAVSRVRAIVEQAPIDLTNAEDPFEE